MEKEQKQFEPVKEYFEGYLDGYKEAILMMQHAVSDIGPRILNDTEVIINNKIHTMEVCDETDRFWKQ